jgi:thioredoxin reductase (NADPH)
MSGAVSQIAIIGAGPIGIELAVALKKAGVDYLHFDARQIGHTVSWFAPDTRFFSSSERIAIAGVPLFTPDQSKATREQYLAYLRAVVSEFDLKINTYEPVTEIARGGNGFAIQTGKGNYFAKRIVLATGGTERPRKLNIPGEDLPHVSHYFRDPHPYFRQKLLIVGGKNSAVEAALRSHAVGASVSICHRRGQIDSDRIKYWLWPEINGLMQSGRIATYFNSQPVEIREGFVILQSGNEKTMEVAADFVLLLVGYESDMSLFRQCGVDLIAPDQAPRFNPVTMETNVPGIFVAGTAAGGTQERFTIFIENCHVHVERIMAAITGHAPPEAPKPLERPES